MPVIYAMTGMKVSTVGEMKPVMERARALLHPIPGANAWLPYLGPALDAGMATLFADEIIEALKYLEENVPYTMTPSPTDSNLWLGAADDVIMRERGIEFVDGSAPGFAACVGACPDNETAVRIARELQEKSLYVFMSGETNGKTMAQQLQEEGVQIGWETRWFLLETISPQLFLLSVLHPGRLCPSAVLLPEILEEIFCITRTGSLLSSWLLARLTMKNTPRLPALSTTVFR